jgi:hypothetical protein
MGIVARCARSERILRYSKYRFWLFDGYDIEIDCNAFVIAAHYHEIERFVRVEVPLLMRYIRREVDEIAEPHFVVEPP